jgi:hypothetical protein
MHRCRQETTPELLERLERMRAFSVSTCWRSPDPDEIVPAHSKIIRPLLSASTTALAWPPAKLDRALEYPTGVLVPERGRYRFALSRDVLTSYEWFWNASSWRRGSIVLRLTKAPMNIAEIFMHCSGPAVYSNRHQLGMGDSQGAIRYCYECVSGRRPCVLPFRL